MKTVVAIRHVPFEDLGILADIFAARSWTIRYVEAGIDELLPSAIDTADILIVLGGPIGAYEEDTYPFLKEELCVIENRLARNKPIVGICLGAQLIARALGARVFNG